MKNLFKKNIHNIIHVIAIMTIISLAYPIFFNESEKTSTAAVSENEDCVDITEWDTYTNDEFGISVKYPKGAKAVETGQDYKVLSFSSGPIERVYIHESISGEASYRDIPRKTVESMARTELYCGDMRFNGVDAALYCEELSGVKKVKTGNKNGYYYDIDFRYDESGHAYATRKGLSELITFKD